MALNYDNVSAITKDMIIPSLADNVFKSNPVFMRLYNAGPKYSGGNQILQPLEYATGVAGSYSGYDTFSLVPKEIITDAAYGWRDNYATITISGDEERKNSGENAVINLLEAKTKNARKTLIDNLSYQLFSYGTASDTATYGRGVKGLTGLLSMVNDTSTYGGIVESANTWWAARASSWSATAVSEYAFQGEIGALSDGSDSPNLAVTTQSVFDKFFSVLVDKQRYQSAEMQKAGFKSIALSYDVPLVVDSKCASATMFLLNTDYIKLFIHQDANFKFFPFSSATDQPDVKSASIIVVGNLSCSNRSKQGIVTSIDVTL